MKYNPEHTTAIAMHCYKCGAGISEGYWLADGGPLCNECGQDIREVNTAKNRARERRETMQHRNLLLDGIDELRDAAKTDDDRRSIHCYAIGAAAATLTQEQQESVLRTVRNCIRMYKQKETEEQWAEDQSQCHDHVAGRQGEGR